ncbi:LysR family transcriptional regulator [Methylorubrum extorquens]
MNVSRLEQQQGVRLLSRTTRRVSLTKARRPTTDASRRFWRSWQA